MKIFSINTDKMFTNITQLINDSLPKEGNGLAHIYTPHTTACITTLEDELLHLVDVRFFLDKQVPYVKQPEGEHRNVKYLHEKLFLFLRKKRINVNLHYIPVHLHPYYRKMGFKKGDFKNAEDHANRSISLPIFPGLKKNKVQLIYRLVNNFFLQNAKK